MNRPKFFFATLLWGLLTVSQASAIDVKFGFSGEVVGYLTASPATMNAFPVGTPIVGHYSFNPLSIDLDADPQKGFYSSAVTALEASIGGSAAITLAISGFREIRVEDNSFLGGDVYSVLADVTGSVAPGISASRIAINLIPGSASAFDSDALPLIPPSLSHFPATFESQLVLQSLAESVLFKITSLSLVPEPTSALLLSGGMLALASLRRRR